MLRTRTLTALAAVVLLGACTPRASTQQWTFSPLGGGPPSGAPSTSVDPGSSNRPGGARGAGNGEVLGTLEITSVDLGFEPRELLVSTPGKYEVKLTNDGAIPHDITFPDGQQVVAESGESGSVVVEVPADGSRFICSIPGHSDAGMQGSISVEGSTPGGGGGGDHGGPTPATDIQPDADAPSYTLHDPAAPRTTHGHDARHRPRHRGEADDRRGRLRAERLDVQRNSPGAGDPRQGRRHDPRPPQATRLPAQLPHSIDFHASQVAWNDEMTSINPGEEKVYEWRPTTLGVWMYHCGTAPALHHIANGMFGMVIVEPTDGLPEVDAEFAFVQSEWYLGPQGRAVSASTKAAAAGAGAGLRRLQRRREPVPRQPDRGRYRRPCPGIRPERRAVHRQLVPRRRHDLRRR